MYCVVVIVRTTELKQYTLSSKRGGCTPTKAIKRNDRRWRPTWMGDILLLFLLSFMGRIKLPNGRVELPDGRFIYSILFEIKLVVV